MIGKPGGALWLLQHEMRVRWRGIAAGGRGKRGLWIGGVALLLVSGAVGVPLALAARSFDPAAQPGAEIMAAAGLLLVFSLMLSQTLASAVEALYQRGDLDLLFSSPLPPQRILAIRFFALALNAFIGFAMLASPLLLPVIVLARPGWITAYGVLAAVALVSSAGGLALATALFAAIGPRRTRTIAQVLAAVIGAAFFLASQAHNLLGGRAQSLWASLLAWASAEGRRIPSGLDWPLRALTGDIAPLLGLLVGAILIFLAASQILGARFAADTAAAQGADAAPARAAARASFAGGMFVATLRKELRLIARDASLISQVLLRVLYLAPLAFVLVREAAGGRSLALPGAAAAVAFMAGQVSGSLAWITISAEEAPDLLAAAPVSTRALRRAKLAAALAPLVLVLTPVLVILTVLQPGIGLAAIVGCAAAALAAGLLAIWMQRPARRSEFRQQRSANWVAGVAEFVITSLIAGATGMAASGNAWAVAPGLAAGAMLLGLRRSDEQIARTLRQASRGGA